MKTLLDKPTRDELIRRINTLNEKSTAQWGKMTIYQMLAHCARCEEMMLGRKLYKREFMGRIFGKIAIKGFLKDDSPLKHGMPTVPAFRVKENTGDTAAEKAKLIALVEAYAHFSNPYSIHPFFGKMTAAQIGLMEYKHLDHHLRQFNS